MLRDPAEASGPRSHELSHGPVAGDVEVAQRVIERLTLLAVDAARDTRTVPQPVAAAVQRTEHHDPEIPRTLQQPRRQVQRLPGVFEKLFAQRQQLGQRRAPESLGRYVPLAEAPLDLGDQLRGMGRRRTEVVVAGPPRDLDAGGSLAVQRHRNVVSHDPQPAVEGAPERRGRKPFGARPRVLHSFVPPLEIVVDSVMARRLTRVERRPGGPGQVHRRSPQPRVDAALLQRAEVGQTAVVDPTIDEYRVGGIQADHQ